MTQEQRDEFLHADEIAAKAAKMAVKNVFAILGIDIEDPRQVEEFRQDLRFGSKLRKAADRSFIMAMAVGFGVLLLAAWTTISAKFGA